MEQISIRSLQHFLYCPHRWGLIEIDRSWAENGFVTRGNIAHERVHSGIDYSLRGAKTFTAVRIWNDHYGLYGETDGIEVKKDHYTLVEYKPTMPKGKSYQEADALQVFAQKVCVDQIFHCDADAVIYYTDIRRRMPLPFNEEREKYQKLLESILEEMRADLKNGTIPPIRTGQNCNGCSMKDLCIPAAHNKRSNIRNEMMAFRNKWLKVFYKDRNFSEIGG